MRAFRMRALASVACALATALMAQSPVEAVEVRDHAGETWAAVALRRAISLVPRALAEFAPGYHAPVVANIFHDSVA